MNGDGVYLFADGTTYKGYFKNNRFDKFGTQPFQSHHKSPCEFLTTRNRTSFIGRAEYSTGSYYYGMWRNGKYNGKGTLTFKDGSVYEV